MLKFQQRVMVATFVAVDVVATVLAWLAAYLLRFRSESFTGLVPVTKGLPDLDRYLLLVPVLVVLWPVILYFHGLYKIRRSRSRIDEFFGIVFSVLIASGLALGASLYLTVYHAPVTTPGDAPAWEYSRVVFALFVALDVAFVNVGRTLLRRRLQRRWAEGHNVRRVLIAGTGELGRTVAETIHGHAELGYRVVGFIDDDPARAGLPGMPLLGRLEDAARVAVESRADELYIALPLEESPRLLPLIKAASLECLDIKVVPDLVQYATLKAGLEDLDGVPIISLNEVPLRGWNSMAKRVMDVLIGGTMLVFLAPVFLALAALVKWKGGRGPVLLRQERMTLDGRTFDIFKFRTMVDGAEDQTGPVFATSDDPRRTAIGAWLRKYNLDEFPQLLNVFLGDMSLVGPRPERPPFVQQFKQRIPNYMLRHRVKSGITGWAQVNGWRGNSSIEKRIECDLYYIENWSLLLDVKILILTLFRGFGQKHAY
jgi:Undecaprenyl-phosphate glucose phosphotransferase